MDKQVPFEAYEAAREAVDNLVTGALYDAGFEDLYAAAQESGEEPERLPDGGFSFEVVIRPN